MTLILKTEMRLYICLLYTSMDKRYDKKILFFDVDDTLVDSKTGKVPESTIEALHNLQENGQKRLMD